MAWGDDQKNPWGNSPWGQQGGNDNQGGKTPQKPDFDEQFRKAQEKFRSMFGDGGKDGKRGILLIVLAIFVLWMASGIYLVKPDEEGVVLRFGAFHRKAGAGLNYHLPYPVETVFTPQVTAINRVEIGKRANNERARGNYNEQNLDERLMLTGDENIVDINFEVQWQIRDAPDFLFNVRDPENTVKIVAESAMREVIGHTKIAAALSEGKLEVAQETKKLLQSTLDEYKAGIEIVSVNLLDTDPPSQVIDAFRDVQTARADMETSRNQADAYRNDIVPRARGEAQQLVLEAEGYKQEVIARAQGEASRFTAIYNEYRQAKDVTKKRMYLETMEDILGGMNKVIIDQKGSNGVLPYLPLKGLKNKQGGDS